MCQIEYWLHYELWHYPLALQVEQNVEFVRSKRDEVAFSPKDQQLVESFLQVCLLCFNNAFLEYADHDNLRFVNVYNVCSLKRVVVVAMLLLLSITKALWRKLLLGVFSWIKRWNHQASFLLCTLLCLMTCNHT